MSHLAALALLLCLLIFFLLVHGVGWWRSLALCPTTQVATTACQERKGGRKTAVMQAKEFGCKCMDICWEPPPHPKRSFSSHVIYGLDGVPNISRGLSRPLVLCLVCKDMLVANYIKEGFYLFNHMLYCTPCLSGLTVVWRWMWGLEGGNIPLLSGLPSIVKN